MGVIDRLERQTAVPDVLDGLEHLSRIHDEGDLGAFFRREPGQVSDFGFVEGGGIGGAFEADDILDAVHAADGLPRPGQKPAAFIGVQRSRMLHEFVEDRLGNG